MIKYIVEIEFWVGEILMKGTIKCKDDEDLDKTIRMYFNDRSVETIKWRPIDAEDFTIVI